ncbi:MAG: ThuA domain-containing protein [Verrucomicrobiota bacterium]|nr:ThuA domain-containing protein [Verrucomicrobiota bacterium]
MNPVDGLVCFARRVRSLCCLAACLAGCLLTPMQADGWVTYEGHSGVGKGKHIVFITGDEEYRSEEGMPMMAKILSVHHGFDCTVLFAMDDATGTIDPNNQTNIKGMHFIKDADLVVLFTRFRELPDQEMKYFDDYYTSGKPIIALRTSTHAFSYTRNTQSPYAHYHWQSKEWPGGFGQQVLGETWVNHHGHHGRESTRGVIEGRHKDHPVLKGVKDIWGPTDVYGTAHLPGDISVLVHGLTLDGMQPDALPNYEKPLMPVAWVREHPQPQGRNNRVFCSTMGAATDLESADLRRLLVNACFWGLELEDTMPDHAKVDYVGTFKPTGFGFNGFVKGIKPQSHALK